MYSSTLGPKPLSPIRRNGHSKNPGSEGPATYQGRLCLVPGTRRADYRKWITEFRPAPRRKRIGYRLAGPRDQRRMR